MATAAATIVALAVAGASADPIRYDGNKVVRVVPVTDEATSMLHVFGERNPDIDFWQRPSRPGTAVDVRIASGKSSSDKLMSIIETRHDLVNATIMIEDLQQLIDAEKQGMVTGSDRRRQADDPWTWFYHTYDEIVTHFKNDIVPQYPNIASIFSIGESYEGNDLMVIRITGPSGGGLRTLNGTVVANDKPGYWMESLIHSREWITGATLAWVVEDILKQYGSDAEITKLVDDFDLYFLLVTNPDGYKYTHNGDRMWRKTRKPNERSVCIGTDPNRNWDFHWNEAGTSTNPCSDTFGGSGPASEPEVVAVQDFLKSHGGIEIFVDFHAYSQLWLTPWGWTSSLPPREDHNNQMACAREATEALTAVHGTSYRYGPISTTIYPASGSSVDYAYGVTGTKYSFGPEGRDTGRFGFLLPAIEIVPSAQENMQAILAMARCVAKLR